MSNNRPEVLSLYHNTANEITRYRDMEWKISLWAFSFLIGLFSITRFIQQWDNYESVKPGFQFLIIWILLFSIVHLYFCHRELTINRRVFRRCEQELNLDDILPSNWNVKPEKIGFRRGIFHLISWIFFMLVIAIVIFIYL